MNAEFLEFLRSFSVAARERSKSASSSSSNASRSDRRVRGENQDAVLRDYNGNDNNSGSSTPRSRDDPAFDIITQQTGQNAVCDDSFFVRIFLWKDIVFVNFLPTARQTVLTPLIIMASLQNQVCNFYILKCVKTCSHFLYVCNYAQQTMQNYTRSNV